MASFIVSMPILIIRNYAHSKFKTNEAAMSWMVIIAILGPAQGFLNALVFFGRINGFQKFCRCCTFEKLCRCCSKDGDKKTDKKDNSPPTASDGAPEKEKHVAPPRVSSVTLGTKESGKTGSTTESYLEDVACGETPKATQHELPS